MLRSFAELTRFAERLSGCLKVQTLRVSLPRGRLLPMSTLADVLVLLSVILAVVTASVIAQIVMLRRLDRLTRAVGVLVIQECAKVRRLLRG